MGVVKVGYKSSLILAIGTLANFNADKILVLVQGSLGFVIGSINQLMSLAPGIKFIALATGRQSRVVSKLQSYGSFFHSDMGGGGTKCNLNLVFNFPSVSTIRAELNRKINCHLDLVVKVDLRCSASSKPPSDYNDAGLGVLDINFCPAPLQLIKQFRIPCVFKSTGWSTCCLTPREIGAAMDLPPSLLPGLESSVADNCFQIEELLLLPLVKGLQFGLTICCGVGLDNRYIPSGLSETSTSGPVRSPAKGLSFEIKFQTSLSSSTHKGCQGG